MSEFLFDLYKTLQILVLPPASLLLLALVCMTLFRRRRWSAPVALLSLLLLAVLATPVVSRSMLDALESRVAPVRTEQLAALSAADSMVVVLGGGRRSGAIEYPGGVALDHESLQRARYAAQVAWRSGLRVAITGGSPVDGGPSEAALTREFLERELGQKVAVVEDKSRTTWENASLSARLLKPLGVRRVVLVTDARHMPRAIRAFEYQGFTVIPAPTGFRGPAALNVENFLPSADGLRYAALSMKEFAGGIVYALVP